MKPCFHKFICSIIIIICVALFTSCSEGGKGYRIGVSQCSGGDWREKMNDEMLRSAIFHPGTTFSFRNAEDDPVQQRLDVEDLIREGVDLLVIAPIDTLEGREIVSYAHQQGIPVIVADRRIGGREYTAFVGGNNYEVGVNAASYLAQQLPEGGKVMEITGKQGSTPVTERHQGFVDELSKYPRFQLIKSEDGYWLRDSAKVRMDQTLRNMPDIRAVFAHNDYMAMGASEMSRWVRSFRRRDSLYVPDWDPVFVGVDAVYGEDHGLEWVTHGDLSASVLYPTGGDVIVETAIHILKGEPYERDIVLPTFVVDARQAALLNNMDLAVIHEVDKVHWLQTRQRELLRHIDLEHILGALLIIFLVCIIAWMLQMRRHFLERRRTALRLVRANRRLRDAAIAELVARQNEESGRDNEAGSVTSCEADAANSSRLTPNSENPSLLSAGPLGAANTTLAQIDPFIEQIYRLIDENYSRTDFGVEHLSVLLDMSRSQLYRKVKQMTGMTPFDMIREKRFSEAERLLAQGVPVEDVASKVGFSGTAYFVKCLTEYQELSQEI